MPEPNEIEPQTPEETPEKTPAETPEGTGKSEEVDYKTKFVESQKEALRLKTENDSLKAQKPNEVPEDEKKIRDVLFKAEKEKEEQNRLGQEQLRKDMEGLHTIYGDFDEKKLQQIADRYGVLGDDGNVNWYAAMELYEKIAEVPVEPVKPKTPQLKREGAVPQAEVETPVDVSKKSLHELVQDGLKKFGL